MAMVLLDKLTRRVAEIAARALGGQSPALPYKCKFWRQFNSLRTRFRDLWRNGVAITDSSAGNAGIC